MGELRRLRAALTVAAACVLVLASAALYLHPMLPGRPTPRPSAATLTSPIAARLQDFAVAAKVAWACLVPLPAGTGLLYASSDGGRTWRQLPFPSAGSGDSKLGVQLIDATHGVLQVLGGLYTTADGGRQWRTASLPPGQRFAPGAHFLSPTQGWYQDLSAYPNQVEQPTAMWWTSDGGISWSERWRVDAQHPRWGELPLDGSKYVLGFRDSSTGWLEVTQRTATALAIASTLLMTSDGGRDWSPANPPLHEAATFSDLELPSDGSAVLVAKTGSGYLAIPSRDGGLTWEDARPIPILTTPDRGPHRVSFFDHDHWATARGSLLQITSDAGRTWRTVHASLPRGVVALVDVWLTGTREGLATGDDGSGNLRVLRTTDGGADWTLSPVPYLTRS